jgi:chromosome segregation ATPase
LNTQKEILKQFEISKKEYINRLKRELETVEERFVKIINQNTMVGEDYRSQAYMNFNRLITTKLELKAREDELAYTQNIVKDKLELIEKLEKEHQDNLMLTEDHVCQIFYKSHQIEKLNTQIKNNLANISELTTTRDEQKQEIDELSNQVRDLRADLKQSYADYEKSKKDN